jgi:hypothetical protein
MALRLMLLLQALGLRLTLQAHGQVHRRAHHQSAANRGPKKPKPTMGAANSAHRHEQRALST